MEVFTMHDQLVSVQHLSRSGSDTAAECVQPSQSSKREQELTPPTRGAVVGAGVLVVTAEVFSIHIYISDV